MTGPNSALWDSARGKEATGLTCRKGNSDQVSGKTAHTQGVVQQLPRMSREAEESPLPKMCKTNLKKAQSNLIYLTFEIALL